MTLISPTGRFPLNLWTCSKYFGINMLKLCGIFFTIPFLVSRTAHAFCMYGRIWVILQRITQLVLYSFWMSLLIMHYCHDFDILSITIITILLTLPRTIKLIRNLVWRSLVLIYFRWEWDLNPQSYVRSQRKLIR